jgi:hypothetical protein
VVTAAKIAIQGAKMFKHISVKNHGLLTRVNCFKEYFSTTGQPDFTFWVPTSSLDEYGMVPGNTIRSRIKHALKVNQGHFSYTTETDDA